MNFALNDPLTIDIQHIGRSNEPILVIDQFLRAPDLLVQHAAAEQNWRAQPKGAYPGLRAGLPQAYVRAVLKRLNDAIQTKLLPQPLKLDKFDCAFSMVTHAPDDLASAQQIPHIDIARPNRVAILHYLCSPEFGGTAFFRQQSTGLEQIGPEDRSAYQTARNNDLRKLSHDARYPDADTPGYVQTGQISAAFNRIIAYRSFTLHSGIINAPESLSKDPSKGRLTANFFVDYA